MIAEDINETVKWKLSVVGQKKHIWKDTHQVLNQALPLGMCVYVEVCAGGGLSTWRDGGIPFCSVHTSK